MSYDIKVLSGREFEKVVDYFLNLTPEDDIRMQIDRAQLLEREAWVQLLLDDSEKPLGQRQYYYVGWLLNDQLVGHCGLNQIKIGEEAFVHLHCWSPELRAQGLGWVFFLKAVQFYFETCSLKKIICEPNALNPAPNKLLLKVGFRFCGSYRAKPGMFNHEHEVNRYELNRLEML